MAKTLDSQLKIIDENIRSGKGEEARNILKALTQSKVPREKCAAVARLARRCGQPEVGLRLLRPFVKPRDRKPVDATSEEKAEYGMSLTKAGAVEEGYTLLETLKDLPDPKILFYRVLSLVAQWRYAESIPLLKTYLECPSLTEYEKIVGKVNLVAAYNYEGRFQEADPILAELIEKTNNAHSMLLYGNTLDLASYNSLMKHDWKMAAKYIQLGERVLKEMGGPDEFYIRKCEMILFLLRDGLTAETKKRLLTIRREAHERRDFETLRDCDRFEAKASRNADLSVHLYYGTPFESFREKVLKESEIHTMPPSYDWHLGEKTHSGPLINLTPGHMSSLPAGTVTSMMQTLASDFYRSFRLATLHSKIYPGEPFSPIYSPPKIRQIIARLRAYFEESRIPIEVAEEDGTYRLRAKNRSDVVIKLPLPGTFSTRKADALTRLRIICKEQPFSMADMENWLDIPKTTLLRLVNTELGKGNLTRVGHGRATRYSFKIKKAS